jgi:hypothetical protein
LKPGAVFIRSEAALHEGIDAASQGLEQGRHHQRGDEVGDLRIFLLREDEQRVLQRYNVDLENAGQHRRKQTID